jgi:repressor LexA
VVATISNKEVTLKKLYIEPDRIRLQPANPKMKPIILHNHEVTIMGVVCAVIRKYRYH